MGPLVYKWESGLKFTTYLAFIIPAQEEGDAQKGLALHSARLICVRFAFGGAYIASFLIFCLRAITVTMIVIIVAEIVLASHENF